MKSHDAPDSNANQPEVTRISAPLTAPLHCAVADLRGDPEQKLIVLTLADRDGATDVIAMIPEDAERLRALLHDIEIPSSANTSSKLKEQFPLLRPHSTERAKLNLARLGPARNFEQLQREMPELANYVDKQWTSLARSIRRFCSSAAARRSLERRLVKAMLVAIDAARPDT